MTQRVVTCAPTRFYYGIDLGYERSVTDLAIAESRQAAGAEYRRAQT